MYISKRVLPLLTITSSAFATVFITNPTATSALVGGQPATITWQDDNNAPSLADFGPATIGIYVGNKLQQTELQPISDSIDVSTASSISFTPLANIGPNSAEYFIRFDSISLKDPASPQFPVQAFSAKFTLSGMSGTFNQTVQSLIDGQSTATIGQTTAAAAAQTTTTNSASTTGQSSTGTKSTSSTPSATKKPSSSVRNFNAGAMKMSIGIVVAFVFTLI